MSFNIQSLKRDINGNFKNVRNFGNSGEDSQTYTCSKCSDTFDKDHYQEFLDHCLNHPKSNERTRKKPTHNSPVKSKRNESKTEQNADSQKRIKIVHESPNSNRGLFENVKSFSCTLCSKRVSNIDALIKHLEIHRRDDELTTTNNLSNGNEIRPAVIRQKEIQSSPRQTIAARNDLESQSSSRQMIVDRNNLESQSFPRQMIIDCNDQNIQNHGLHEMKDEIKLSTVERTKRTAAQENIITQSNNERQNLQLNIDCNPKLRNLNLHKRDNEMTPTQNNNKKNSASDEVKEQRITKVSNGVQTSEYLNTKMFPMMSLLRAYICDICYEAFFSCEIFVRHYNLHQATNAETRASEIQQRNDMPVGDNMKQIDFIMGMFQNFFEYMSKNCNSEIPRRHLQPVSNSEFCEREIAVNTNLVEASQLREERNENIETITGREFADVSDESKRVVDDTEQIQMSHNKNQNLPKQLDVYNCCKASELCTCNTSLGKETETYRPIQDYGDITPMHEYNRKENKIEQNGNAVQNSFKRSNLEILAEASRMLPAIDDVNKELAAGSNSRSDSAHECHMNDESNNTEEIQIVYERRLIQRRYYQVREKNLMGGYDQYVVTERYLPSPNRIIDSNRRRLSERPMQRMSNHKVDNFQHSKNALSAKDRTYSKRAIRELDIPSTSRNTDSDDYGNAIFNSRCADSGGIVRRVPVQNNKSDYNVNEINFTQGRINGMNPSFSKENGAFLNDSLPTFTSHRISDNLKTGNSFETEMGLSSTNQPLKTYANFQRFRIHQNSRNNTGFEQQSQPNLSNCACNTTANSKFVSKNQEQFILNRINRRDINPKQISQLNPVFTMSNVSHQSTNSASFRNFSENSVQNAASFRHTFRNYADNDSRNISLFNKSNYEHESEISSLNTSLPFDKKIGRDSYDNTGSDKNYQIISDKANNVSDDPDTYDDIKKRSDDDCDIEKDTSTQSAVSSRNFFREKYSNHARMPESRTKVISNRRNKTYPATEKNNAISCEKCDLIFEDHAEYVDHFLEHKNEKESPNNPSETKMCHSTEKKYKYKCSACGKKYRYKTSLNDHIKSHQSNYRKCKMCRKGFLSESSVDDTIKGFCKDCETVVRFYADKLNNPSITTNKEKCSEKDKEELIHNSKHNNQSQSNKECSKVNRVTMECEVNKRKECLSTENQNTECFREENQNNEDCGSSETERIKENGNNSISRKGKRETLDCRRVGTETVDENNGGNMVADDSECFQVNLDEMRKEPISYANYIKNRVSSEKVKNHKQRENKNINEACDRNELVRNNENLTDTDAIHKERDAPCEADDEMESQNIDMTGEEAEVNNSTCEPEQEKSPKSGSNSEDFSKKCEKSKKIVMQLLRCDNNEYRLKNSSVSPCTLICKYCTAVFRERWAFIKHTREHTGSEHFLCNICDRRIKSRPSLTKHFRSEHPKVKI
ncbi:Zinc finger protein 646 like protein [Argiope bruennichi]|uniref:Zinc finger protein 646 like protein n=1 Tax=Argiope bruennichi TaxID=94029 RepID=A0A8T0ENP6_ARGBR|nr:Zinc finger protein 646 like protein [Argiope bruennichi]